MNKEKNTETTQVNTELLNKLLKLTAALLDGDCTVRIVTDFKEDIIHQIITNLNRYSDKILLNSSGVKNATQLDINDFIDVLSSFANHDFVHKLPVSEGGTILDAIATGINLLGEELEHTTASREELNSSFTIVSEQNKRLMNFSYIVSHNLRSHTNNIKSLLDLLETTDSERSRKKIMRHLKTSSALLNETIVHLNDIVSIQKNIDILIEPLNLHSYINNVCEVLSEQISLKKAEIHNNVSEEIIINYNPAYLESILLNFLSNSLKYSHSERIPVISFNFFTKNGKGVLEVSDNGLGIDLKKHGDKLFGMYKTFHGNEDARGIGLFITKNQIEAMGGKLEVESEPNERTSFRISFSSSTIYSSAKTT